MNANTRPTLEVNVPEIVDGDGARACELASVYFGEALAWQPHILDVMLARDARDKYAVRTFALAVPRQNGKSWTVRARCFYGALVAGEKILYTCQHGDTSDEMFKALSAPFEDDDCPELQEHLKAVRKTNGQQAIWFKNGGGIRFTTRTDSLARGKTYDVLIYDEAQELTAGQQSASLSSISAGYKKNPQTIYLGTPPEPESNGTVFRKIRDDVLSGDSAASWVEWSVDEIGDVKDRTRWYATNPSLGDLVQIEAVEGECDQMTPDTFARERLGWWSPVGGAENRAIDAKKWAACMTQDPMDAGKLAFGVKFAPDGSMMAVSWARAVKGEGSYVELYDVVGSAGAANVAAMLVRNKGQIAAVFVDGKSGAVNFKNRLIDEGFPQRAVTVGTPAIMQAASTMLRDEVEAETLRHIESPALDDSAVKSIKRNIGKDGWGFGDGVDSSSAPIESAALALWAARTTRRNPERTQEASF